MVLGLVRAAAGSDASIGIWLAATLPALAGAGAAGSYRRKLGRNAGLRHFMLGAYTALTIVVTAAVVLFDSRVVAAVIGSGVLGAACTAMLAAGVKGRTSAQSIARETDGVSVPPPVRFGIGWVRLGRRLALGVMVAVIVGYALASRLHPSAPADLGAGPSASAQRQLPISLSKTPPNPTDPLGLLEPVSDSAETHQGPGALNVDSLFAASSNGVREPLVHHRPKPGSLGTIGGDDSDMAALFKRAIEQAFDEAADLLQDYRLPAPIQLHASVCGRRGSALYDRARHRVELCSEFIVNIYDHAPSDDIAFRAEHARDVVRFVMAHELGHALIHLYRLPVLGREEDAADQFAAMLFLTHRRPNPLLSAAMDFGRVSSRTSPDQGAWGDEHSLDKQREANLVCWLYGSDSTAFLEVAEMLLPDRRRANCRAELSRLLVSLNGLLAHHRRPE